MGELIPLEVRNSIDEAFDKNIQGVAELAQFINLLINQDLNRLLHILYRLDVSEEKLRQSLKDNTEVDTGTMMAQLIIERQMQKAETRNSIKRENDIPEDDKWP